MGNYGGRTRSEIYTDIDTNTEWLEGISHQQRTRLKNYLLNLDKTHREDLESDRTRTVYSGVKQIVERISVGIRQYDPRLTGTLVPMGSASDQTKLGDPDEFDYAYQIDLIALLQGRGSFERMHGEDIVLKMEGDVVEDMVKYKPGQNKTFLDMVRVTSLLGNIILKVLSELELPPGWQHGGIHRPSFSGIRKQGPSFVLQFDNLDTSDQVPLCLSVNFMPMITIPFTAVEYTCMHIFLNSVTQLQYIWVSINNHRISYSHAESMFLRLFSPASTVKKLIRISKALRIVLQMHLTAYLCDLDVIQLLITHKGIHTRYINTYINSSTRKKECVTYSDLGESEPDKYMIKSYCVKQAVLEMISEDESHGRGWTDDDLPELVIRVYGLLLDSTYIGLYTGNLVKQKIFIYLEDEYKTTTPKGPPHTRKTTLHLKPTDSTLCKRYTKQLRDIDGKCEGHMHDLCLISRIAGLFQLFRCVGEGKIKVELVIFDRTELKPMLSKKRFKEISEMYEKKMTTEEKKTEEKYIKQVKQKKDQKSINKWNSSYYKKEFNMIQKKHKFNQQGYRVTQNDRETGTGS